MFTTLFLSLFSPSSSLSSQDISSINLIIDRLDDMRVMRTTQDCLDTSTETEFGESCYFNAKKKWDTDTNETNFSFSYTDDDSPLTYSILNAVRVLKLEPAISNKKKFIDALCGLQSTHFYIPESNRVKGAYMIYQFLFMYGKLKTSSESSFNGKLLQDIESDKTRTLEFIISQAGIGSLNLDVIAEFLATDSFNYFLKTDNNNDQKAIAQILKSFKQECKNETFQQQRLSAYSTLYIIEKFPFFKDYRSKVQKESLLSCEAVKLSSTQEQINGVPYPNLNNENLITALILMNNQKYLDKWNEDHIYNENFKNDSTAFQKIQVLNSVLRANVWIGKNKNYSIIRNVYDSCKQYSQFLYFYCNNQSISKEIEINTDDYWKDGVKNNYLLFSALVNLVKYFEKLDLLTDNLFGWNNNHLTNLRAYIVAIGFDKDLDEIDVNEIPENEKMVYEFYNNSLKPIIVSNLYYTRRTQEIMEILAGCLTEQLKNTPIELTVTFSDYGENRITEEVKDLTTNTGVTLNVDIENSQRLNYISMLLLSILGTLFVF